MGVFDGGTAEADLRYQYSSKDKKWAMYCAYLGKEDDWLQPPHEFLPEKKEITRGTLLRRRFVDFLDSFTAHGPARAHGNANCIRRLIWTVLFAMCLMYGLYQCYNVFEEYLTYPKSVNIEVLSERKVDFPAVSLCNLNPLNVKDEVSRDKIYGGFVELENDNVEARCSGLTPNTEDPLDKEMCSPYNKSCSPPEKAPMSTLVDNGLRPTSSPLETTAGTLNDTLGEVTGALNDTLGAVTGVLNNTLGAVDGAVNDTLGAVSGIANETLGAVADTLNDTIGAATGALNDTVKAVEEAIANPVGTVAEGLLGGLGGLVGNTVPSTTVAPKATTATLGSAIDDTVNALGNALGSLGNVVGGLLGRKKRSSYAKDGETIQSENELPNHERERRSSGIEPQYRTPNVANTTVTIPREAIHYRARCSFMYQSLVKQAMEAGDLKTGLGISLKENGVTYGDTTSQCDMEWSTVQETIRYNLACHTNIYCDIYGCYYNVTHAYQTRTLQNGSVITSCSSKPVQMQDLYAEDETKNITKAVVQQIIRNSRTNDLSDVVSRYAPTKQQLEEYMRPAHEFIQLCSIDQTHCSYKLFHGFLSKEYGQCFTFNSPHLDVEGDPPLSDADRRKMFVSRSTYNTGPEGGLRLTLNLNTAEYVSLLSPNTGLRLVLHQPWDAPFPEDEGVNLSPGESHSVGVTKIVMNRVGEPHGQCTSHEFSKFDYTRTLCTKLCLERQYRERCRCKVNEGPVYDLLEEVENPVVLKGAENRTCNPFSISDDTCMKAVYDFFTSESFNCGCNPACKEVKYEAHVTSNSQNRRFLTVAQNTRNIDTGTDICNDTDESTVRVHVYLASPDYTEITESPSYTYNTLVSNTGGNLGLFIGMSIVSFLEVFDLLVDMLLILVSPALYLKTISSRHVQVNQETKDPEPRKVFILAGPPEWLPHGKSDLLQLEEPEGPTKKIYTAS